MSNGEWQALTTWMPGAHGTHEAITAAHCPLLIRRSIASPLDSAAIECGPIKPVDAELKVVHEHSEAVFNAASPSIKAFYAEPSLTLPKLRYHNQLPKDVKGYSAMRTTGKINKKDLLKHLKYLMPIYIDGLEKPLPDESESRLSIFTNNELFIQYFFSTEYARKHLDYDFFCMAIDEIIGHGKIQNPAVAIEKLSEFVENSANFYHWTAIIPIRFDNMLSIAGVDPITETFSFGRFTILKPSEDLSALEIQFKKELSVASLDSASFHHQFTQGLKQAEAYPSLAFEVRGTTDARNFGARRKAAYFCSLIEVFSIVGDAAFKRLENSQKITKSFFVNMQTGKVEKGPLNITAPLNVDMSDAFLQYLHDNDFPYFGDLIFTTEDGLFARLRSALNFFSKGFNSEDRVLEFVCYVIGIEALFTGLESNGIVSHLSICVSRLCYPENDWPKIEADVKEMYRQRSSIMHHGKFDLSNGKVEQARNLAARAIFHTLKLHKHLFEVGANGSAKGDMAQRYASHLKQWLSDKQAVSADPA